MFLFTFLCSLLALRAQRVERRMVLDRSPVVDGVDSPVESLGSVSDDAAAVFVFPTHPTYTKTTIVLLQKVRKTIHVHLR